MIYSAFCHKNPNKSPYRLICTNELNAPDNDQISDSWKVPRTISINQCLSATRQWIPKSPFAWAITQWIWILGTCKAAYADNFERDKFNISLSAIWWAICHLHSFVRFCMLRLTFFEYDFICMLFEREIHMPIFYYDRILFIRVDGALWTCDHGMKSYCNHLLLIEEIVSVAIQEYT